MKRITFLLLAAATLSMAAYGQNDDSFLDKVRPDIQYTRPGDKTGINVFETTKDETTPYEGFKVKVGAGFTQSFQT